jgi:hypothetical protein
MTLKKDVLPHNVALVQPWNLQIWSGGHRLKAPGESRLGSYAPRNGARMRHKQCAWYSPMSSSMMLQFLLLGAVVAAVESQGSQPQASAGPPVGGAPT